MSDAYTEAYPLYWPENRARTRFRNSSKFNTSFTKARDAVVREVKLMVGRYDFSRCGFVLSTNVNLRRDGLPLAGQRQPQDPGAAVYFMRKGKRVCFACDRWLKVEENIYAIAKTVEALRGIDRWGTGDMVDAAFMGFTALPAAKHWADVLDLPHEATCADIREAFRMRAHDAHPDKGGSAAAMVELTAARDAALRERGVLP